MNLSEFFTPSLERGIEQRSFLKMPPRSSKEGVVVVYESSSENNNNNNNCTGPMLLRNPPPHAHQQQQLAQEFRMMQESSGGRERSGGGRSSNLNMSSSTTTRASGDVTILVGRNRASYTISAETLRQSAYFSSLLADKRIIPSAAADHQPVVVDCDESVFQNMMLVLRYGSFEALPWMSDSELFRLKRELEIHGIEIPPENFPRKESSSAAAAARSGNLSPSSSSSLVSISKSSYQQQQQQQQQQQHSSILELPDFPEELKDVSKIVLVARIDEDERGRCGCMLKAQHSYWALSFHYRHAFCTGCSKSASATLSRRFVAEIYMAAAMYYSGETRLNVTNKQKWSVGCDSTCSLKLLNARACCLCPCCCPNSPPPPPPLLNNNNNNSKTSISSSNSNTSSSNVWAVSTYHSHAFCTRCGQSANDQTLVCILLTLRYGGVSKSTMRLS